MGTKQANFQFVHRRWIHHYGSLVYTAVMALVIQSVPFCGILFILLIRGTIGYNFDIGYDYHYEYKAESQVLADFKVTTLVKVTRLLCTQFVESVSYIILFSVNCLFQICWLVLLTNKIQFMDVYGDIFQCVSRLHCINLFLKKECVTPCSKINTHR